MLPLVFFLEWSPSLFDIANRLVETRTFFLASAGRNTQSIVNSLELGRVAYSSSRRTQILYEFSPYSRKRTLGLQ